MEEDRAIADLGPTVSAELNGDTEALGKKPKRRFIGRKAAEAKAAARAEASGGTIEDSGAVQGAAYHTPPSYTRGGMLMVQQWHQRDGPRAP